MPSYSTTLLTVQHSKCQKHQLLADRLFSTTFLLNLDPNII